MTLTRRTLLILSAAAMFVPTRPAGALFGIGDIVHDPLTFGQSVLTAFRSLQSNVNEATQIKQQIDAYVQQAKHLVALPLSLVDQISMLYAQYNDILATGKGIAYTARDVTQQFEALYDAGMNGNMPLMQRAHAVIGQVRAASHSLARVSAIYTRLCNDQAQVQTLMSAAMAAPGTLAAQQASAQLLGVISSQQGSLQEIAATTGRVQMGWIMREVTAEEQAQWNSQQWMQGFPTAGMRGPKQGQGPKLPD